MITRDFVIGIFLIVIVYDVFAFIIGGTKATISNYIYNLSNRPVLGKIVIFLSGALLYHLFICPPGCG